MADAIPPGARVGIVLPVIHRHKGTAEWTRLVRIRAIALAHALGRDPHLRRIVRIKAGRRGGKTTLRAVIYQRRAT
jgi:hypothetical protein